MHESTHFPVCIDDPFERLANAGGVGFVTSVEGQRIEKLAGTGPQYFAPSPDGTLLADHVNNWYDYVWLNGRVVTVISNGGVFPLHDDQTERPLYLTDPNSRAVDWAAQGLPFDRNVTTNRWGSFNVGFPGQYFDQEDDLWHNGNRDYDASLGRYIESDPIGLAGGVNTYAYVGDNPVTRIDPNGRLWITAAIGAVTGGLAGYEAGGLKGALAGGVAGAVVGFVDPLASEAVGAAAAEWVGGSAVAGALVSAGTTVTLGAAGGLAANVGYNALYNSTRSGCQSARGWDQGAGYAMALGAAAPLMSGEAFAAGSGALGETGLNVFSGITGGITDIGELGDPDAGH